jgi:hypothetical protein
VGRHGPDVRDELAGDPLVRDGDTPRALEEGFTGLGATDTSTRTDLYLAPADPSLDLELRGGESGSLEVKRRLAGPDRRTFGPEVAGNVEQWYNWSFPLAHAPGLRTDDRTGLWARSRGPACSTRSRPPSYGRSSVTSRTQPRHTSN